MTHSKHAIAILSLLTFVLAAGITSCSNGPRSLPAAPETVSSVPVSIVQRAMVTDWLEAVGTVRAAQTSQLASQIMGNLIEVRAREGERVQPGQVLALIDDAQPRASVEQATAAESAAAQEVSAAESDLALAAATLKRYQQLFDKKSASPQEFDEIKARYRSAEARHEMARARHAQASAALAQARTSLSYARIRAPFAGLVTERRADPGALASPGMPIFTIEDTRSYRLEATVDETDLPVVRTGESLPVILDALGSAELSGKVVQIVPSADPASRSFLVKVQLPADSRLRSGLFGRARFGRGKRPALLIPRAAMVQRGQLQAVYVIDSNQVATLRYVTLGNAVGDQFEVLSGLQEGEKLVAVPGDLELAGKRIALAQ